MHHLETEIVVESGGVVLLDHETVGDWCAERIQVRYGSHPLFVFLPPARVEHDKNLRRIRVESLAITTVGSKDRSTGDRNGIVSRMKWCGSGPD